MPDAPIPDTTWQWLAAEARGAAEKAYAPYSRFQVGAALLCADGTVVTGCNVENASYGLTICAERNAVAAAVAQGHRDFRAIVVVSPNGVTPCGACRQVLSEFAPAMPVRLLSKSGKVTDTSVGALLPSSFGKQDLG